MSNTADVRNSVAPAAIAADSGPDIDDTDTAQAEIEADLLESVYIILWREDTKKGCQQTIIRKLQILELKMEKKKCRGKDKVCIATHFTIL